MKAKRLSLAIAALLAAGGLWFLTFHKSSVGEMPRGQALSPSSMPDDRQRVSGPEAGPGNSKTSSPKPGQMLNPTARLAPPELNRRFTDFTPEQRVQFARQGHGPGG